MKKILLTFGITTMLFLSCSKDAVVDALTGDNAIEGTWVLTDFNADAEAAGTNLNLGEDILDALTAEGCVLVSFKFDEDGNLETQSGVNYLEINAGLTGLEVSCPTEKDIEFTLYTYANGLLTFLDESGEEVTVEATIDGDIMTVNAQDLDLPNFNSEGELIFTKQ